MESKRFGSVMLACWLEWVVLVRAIQGITALCSYVPITVVCQISVETKIFYGLGTTTCVVYCNYAFQYALIAIQLDTAFTKLRLLSI